MANVKCSLVRLAYIDETYSADEFWLLGLVIPDTGAKALEDALNAIVRNASQSFPGIDPGTELHGYALDDGRDGWEPLKPMPQARADIYKAAIRALCSIPDVMLIRSGVNLKRVIWSASNDPHEWALTFLVELIDRAFLGRDLVLAICDDVGQRERYREAFRKFKVEGTGGTQPRKLDAFLDALHFVPSHHSRLVQAVDLAAYAFRRAQVAPPTHPKARKLYADLWQMMDTSLEHRARAWPTV